MLLVDNAATAGAVKDIFEQSRTILEPAGAVSVAGAKAYLKARPHIQVSSNCLPDMLQAPTQPPRHDLEPLSYQDAVLLSRLPGLERHMLWAWRKDTRQQEWHQKGCLGR